MQLTFLLSESKDIVLVHAYCYPPQLLHMITKIVHISICNNYPRLSKFLYIPECVRSGLDVIFLDLSELVGGQVQGLSAVDCNEISVVSLGQFDDLLLSHQEDTLFNVQIGYEYRWRRIFQLIEKRCLLTSMFMAGFFPRPQPDMSLEPIKILSLPSKILNKALSYKDRFYPNYVFAAGSYASLPYLRNSKILKIEDRDFQDVLPQEAASLSPAKYIVFIDQYLPFHPDRALTKLVVSDADLYYKSLIAYFDELENISGMKVIVAAHPKSNYSFSAFGQRKIIANETEALISRSCLVLAHYSTAVAYAVKHGIPLVFLSSTTATGVDIRRFVLPFARYFNSQCHELGTRISQFAMPSIDLERYECYKFDFLTWPEREQIISPVSFPEIVKQLSPRPI